jgi:hypothetical protein
MLKLLVCPIFIYSFLSKDSEEDVPVQMPSKQFLSRTSRPQGRSGKQFAGFGKTEV